MPLDPHPTVDVVLHVDIDRGRCAGHGRCYVLAPDVFEPDDEGYAVPIDPAPRDHLAVRKAERNCPEQAVIVEEVAE
jgi:ferredoxin